MLAHRVFAAVQRVLPASVARSLRAAATAFLTPFYFAHSTGHFRSSLRSKAFDQHGAPIPWYTYPANEWLRAKSFAGKRVLEFGAGQSTLWWACKAEAVTSLEDDSAWYHALLPQLPANAAVHLVDGRLAEFDRIVPPEARFDVIVIDGLDRLAAASKSLNRLREGGLLILDNAEGYWGPPGSYPILELLQSAGYARIDLYGFSPGNMLQHCTSFFFRGSCFLFAAHDHPVSLGTLNRYGNGC